MKESQTEIQDDTRRSTEHYNGIVLTAGAPISVVTATGRPIQSFFISNPSIGPRANSINNFLLVSFDNGVNYVTVPRGGFMLWPGKGFGVNENLVKVDAGQNNVKFEILMTS